MGNDCSTFPGGPGWRFFLGSASVLVLRLSADGTILAANRQALTLIDEALVGQAWHCMLLNFAGTIAFTDWLADTSRPRLLNVHTASGLPQTLEVTVEPDGPNYLLFGELNAAQQARLVREVLGLNHELSHLTRELALKNRDLTELNALKNQFLGMAAHDLRKPIGLILSYAGFLLEEAADRLSPEQFDFLQTIHTAADRMQGVVDDFLDVSLIEAGRFELNEQAADLGELAHSALKLVQLTALRRGVSISTALDNASLRLFVDGAKIEQVLTNLLSNAVEHSPSGASVTLASHRLPAELRVQVSDAGPGVAPDQQKNLFQTFGSAQGRKSTGERSAGLGLAIARKIIEAHGGRMFFEPAPVQGAVFGFTLPVHRVSTRHTPADNTTLIPE